MNSLLFNSHYGHGIPSKWNDILTKIHCIYPGPEPTYLSTNLDRLMHFALSRVNDLGEMEISTFQLPFYYLQIFRKSTKKRRSNNQLIYRAFSQENTYIAMSKIVHEISLKLNENEAKVVNALEVNGIAFVYAEGRYHIRPDTVSQLIRVNSIITKYVDS